MKPPPFTYHRAAGVDDALALLGHHGDEAKLLAGGQSLVPLMNLRLARPDVLIDVSRLRQLSYLRADGDGMDIGALTTHLALERHPDYRGSLRSMARAARHIGHRPIRTRGTLGGSLAHADPSAEWCVLLRALGAEVRIAGPHGVRDVGLDDFFVGFFDTAVGPDEMITQVRIPRAPDAAALEEYSRRHGDFAVVVVAVACGLAGGKVRDPRVVAGGVDSTPVRLESCEAWLEGETPDRTLFADAGAAGARDVDPNSDALATAAHRRRLVETLVARALISAVGAAGPDRSSDDR